MGPLWRPCGPPACRRGGEPPVVRRVIDVISKLAEACSPALMLRAAANVAAHALTELFPRSSAVIFEREAGRGTPRRGPPGAGTEQTKNPARPRPRPPRLPTPRALVPL